jgi:sRNA-binding regulator protein Hfq
MNEHAVNLFKPSGEGSNGQPKNEFKQPNYFGRLLNQPAKIKTISGSVIEGTVRGFNSYELLVEIADGQHILLLKHAILFISSDALKPKAAKEKVGGEPA